MSLIQFFSWDSLYEYVAQVTNRPLYSTEIGYDLWKEQFDATLKNQVKAIPKADGSFEYWFETGESDTVITSVGNSYNTSIGSSSGGSSSVSSIESGGVKSAPTVSTIVTDATTETAELTQPSVGMKDVGIGVGNSIGNVLGGVMKAYGLYTLAVTASNVHSWVDFFNTVFGANLPQNASVDDVKAFFGKKWHNIIGGLYDGSTTPTNYVSDTLLTKIYNYLAEHMDSDGTIEGLDVDLHYLTNGVIMRQRPNSRYWSLFRPATGPQNHTMIYHHTYWHENMLHNWILDACSQLIGMGFNVTQNATNILLELTNQLSEYIRDHKPIAIGYKFVRCRIELHRSAGVPLSQPISPSEIEIDMTFRDDEQMVIDASTGTTEEDIFYDDDDQNPWRFSKYGRTGEDIEDFGYRTLSRYYAQAGTSINKYYLHITFPANIFTVSSEDDTPTSYPVDTYFIHVTNGYCDGALNTDEHLPINPTEPQYYAFNYNNLGYSGTTKNYKPDTSLSQIVKKISNTSITPSPEKTKENRYVGWLDPVKHLQVAQVDENGANKITAYVPVTIPYGSNTAKQIADYGYGTSDLPITDPDYNPNGYSDPYPQNYIQSGKVPTDRPINDLNEDIAREINDYNESKKTPTSLPNDLPETEVINYPKYPTEPPTEPTGDSGETPTPAIIGGVTASGMVSVYNPTKQELIDFSGWLWSPSFLDNFLKIFANPMDAIIGLHIMYATPISSGSEHIIAGYLDSNVSSKVVTQQYSKLDCGTIFIPEYYGTAIDYEPYTTIHIYLPFIGIVPLKANDVLGKHLHLEYGIDALTGTCLATLTTIKGDSRISCYTFAGNCAVQIPISGGNYAQMITGLAGFIVAGAGSIATGNPILALGAGASFMSGNVSVQHSGSIGSNAGACGVRKPYVIVTRKITYDAINYNHYYGLPSNKHVKLSTCKGYTQVKSCHVESINRATDNEKKEIDSLLKEGVIII